MDKMLLNNEATADGTDEEEQSEDGDQVVHVTRNKRKRPAYDEEVYDDRQFYSMLLKVFIRLFSSSTIDSLFGLSLK